MSQPNTIVWKVVTRKLAVFLLLAVSGAGAFATLGDGKKKSGSSKSSFLSYKSMARPGSFSLRSGYAYRGNEVINTTEKKYIRLNTTVTSQKGNTTYIVPLKKKVILNNVKIEIGNRQLRRN
ncbi:MAG: hypothetical protein IPP43_06340 [Chitinophagaceae bacterium]|nr:hypothetical protein [Chitinophagaceae bacterium]